MAGYLTKDIENIDKTIWQSIASIIRPFITAFITIAVATWHSPLLGPIALLVSAINYYYHCRTHNLRIELGRLTNTLNRRIRLHTEQLRGGHAMIRAFNRQDHILLTNEQINEDRTKLSIYNRALDDYFSRQEFLSRVLQLATGYLVLQLRGIVSIVALV